MARIAIFLDHDIVIRHFVLNGALRPLEDQHEVVYVFPESHRRVQLDISGFKLPRVRTVPVSSDRAYLYRRLYHATVLKRLRRTPDKKMAFKFWWSQLGRKPFLISWFFSWPVTFDLYRRQMLKEIGENKELLSLLAEEKPDLILHPTVLEGLFVSDLVKWGQVHSVPTLFLMNSWDNPASKAMLVGHPSRLAVWGEPSKAQAVRYLRIPPERVLCMGAAQFDLYRRPPRESVEEFRRRNELPLDKKVLLYAGSSKGLNETRHLQALEEAIEDGRLPNCAVLYRPHPWRMFPEEEADFFSVGFKHVKMAKDMEECYRRSRGSSKMLIELTDFENAHATLSAVDALISPLSTILLEATLHGKPVAAYLPDEDMKQNRWLFTTSNMVHFREFFEQVDCLKCERPEDLVKDCATLLAQSSEAGVAEKLKAQSRPFVVFGEESYGARLSKMIEEWIPNADRNPSLRRSDDTVLAR